MMICPNCKLWCSTTHDQLLNRIKNLADGGPEILVHPCPNCGGIEWAFTDKMIPLSRWQRFLDKFKLV